jgi:hypothetical protein
MGWFSVLVMIPIIVVIPALIVLGSVLWRLAFMRSVLASMDAVRGESRNRSPQLRSSSFGP